MKRRLLLSLFAFLPIIASAQTAGLKPQDLYQLRSIGEAEISPDGTRIIYSIAHNDRPGGPYSSMWIMDLKSARSTRLGDEMGSAGGARWSPDGKWIAYFGSVGAQAGLIVAKADGTSPVVITGSQGTNHPMPSTGERLSWSPDSRRLAYISAIRDPGSDDHAGDPIVISRYLYKPTASNGPQRFNDNRRSHIFVVDVDTKTPRQLTEGQFYEHSIDWSPSGDEILFVSNRESDPDRFFNYDIFTVRVADGTVRRLTSTESVEYRPVWSPDGRFVAYQGTKRGLTSSETTMEDTHVWVMNADGSNRREIGLAIDNRQSAPQWSADGSTLYFTVQERGVSRLYRLPLSLGRPETLLGDDNSSVGSWYLSRNGMIAYTLSTLKDQAQLYMHSNGMSRRLTNVNGEFLPTRRLADVERMTFLSYDGREVESILTKPVDWNAGSKCGLIVMIHGGPHGQQGPAFNFKSQVYAAHGWATLQVNYRGSTGYGQKFADAIFRDQNGGEAKDVLFA
ncbi:MAG: S9 family peptidase, partial [Acidobacteria bacterium]|nr:S9 family peptidase [Acidobacteriota bacterium]